MLRIFGYLLPQNKGINIALTKIFGLGKKLSLFFLKKFNINPHLKVQAIELKRLKNLYLFIERQKNFENNLKKIVNNNIERLSFIKAYRGFRHLSKLPVRGQRTRTNAKTQKKKRHPQTKTKNKKVWKKEK